MIEGHTGFLDPVRSPERIAEKIAWCAEHRWRCGDGSGGNDPCSKLYLENVCG